MGSNSTKAHEVFTVAPTDPADATQTADEDDAAAESPVPGLAHTLELIDGLAQHSDQVGEDLAWLVATAHAEIDALEADEADKQQWRTLVAAKAAGALAELDDAQLQQAAAAKGFAHPTLVSAATNTAGGHGALVHWLNPAYPDDAAAKAKIQAKAAERYQQLAAGEVAAIDGQTLAAVQAVDQQLAAVTPPAVEAWQASPVEVAAAMGTLQQRLVDLHQPGPGVGVTPEADGGLGALLEAERRVVTADCPDMGADLATAQAAAAGLVSKQLDALPAPVRRHMIDQAVGAAAADGTLTEPEAAWLDRDKQLALLRASTPGEVRAQIAQLAADRAGQISAVSCA